MQDQLGVWTIRAPAMSITAGTGKTVIQYVASSTNTAEVLYWSASQSGSTTSAMDAFGLIVPSAAATMAAAGVSTPGTTATVIDMAGGASTLRASLSTTTIGIGPTTLSTINGVPKKFNFNTLAGYEWNAQPNTRLWVPVSGIIQLICYGISTATWDCELVIRESK
jgi:hypothetical protein